MQVGECGIIRVDKGVLIWRVCRGGVSDDIPPYVRYQVRFSVVFITQSDHLSYLWFSIIVSRHLEL